MRLISDSNPSIKLCRSPDEMWNHLGKLINATTWNHLRLEIANERSAENETVCLICSWTQIDCTRVHAVWAVDLIVWRDIAAENSHLLLEAIVRKLYKRYRMARVGTIKSTYWIYVYVSNIHIVKFTMLKNKMYSRK